MTIRHEYIIIKHHRGKMFFSPDTVAAALVVVALYVKGNYHSLVDHYHITSSHYTQSTSVPVQSVFQDPFDQSEGFPGCRGVERRGDLWPKKRLT